MVLRGVHEMNPADFNVTVLSTANALAMGADPREVYAKLAERHGPADAWLLYCAAKVYLRARDNDNATREVPS